MDAFSRLISIDPNPAAQGIAREAFAGDSRLVLLTEDADSFLDRRPPASFDLVFADALAGKYENLEKALAVVRAGGSMSSMIYCRTQTGRMGTRQKCPG